MQGLKKIVCNKKAGFKHPANTIFYIYDFRGILFYTNEFLNKKNISFNLPEGIYYSTCNFKKLHRPNKHKNIVLPNPERNINIKPSEFKIIFRENKNKGTVIYEEKLIWFDTYYKTCPLPEFFFTLYHEFGHLLYGTEKYCDLYAAKRMLDEGYNISQVGKSSVLMLSNRAKERKIFLVDKLT